MTTTSDTVKPTHVPYTNKINLGNCTSFALFAGSGYLTAGDSGNNIIINKGNVCCAPDNCTIPFDIIQGTIENNTHLANQCVFNLITASNDAAQRICPTSNIIPDGGLTRTTLYSGVYCSKNGYMAIESGNLTLDAQNNPNSVWIFQIPAVFTVGVTFASQHGPSINLVNGANSENVY